MAIGKAWREWVAVAEYFCDGLLSYDGVFLEHL